jgi:hypothetical protein
MASMATFALKVLVNFRFSSCKITWRRKILRLIDDIFDDALDDHSIVRCRDAVETQNIASLQIDAIDDAPRRPQHCPV